MGFNVRDVTDEADGGQTRRKNRLGIFLGLVALAMFAIPVLFRLYYRS